MNRSGAMLDKIDMNIDEILMKQVDCAVSDL
jgi:hypothetical protein